MITSRAVILHASRAAVDCVAEYYAAHAPEIEFTHLLDDGIMRMLRAEDWPGAIRRLSAMAEMARAEYGATSGVLTCSALPPKALEELKKRAPIPLFKIDEPMARLAVRTSTTIGVLSTFPATQQTTHDLLVVEARRAGIQITIFDEMNPAPLQALLAGDRDTHDRLFFETCERFAHDSVGVLVLAQVSMARLAPAVRERLGIPVLESLSTSLDILRHLCAERR
ncbi:MAG: aspartate/glutamate racemase family protein [Acidobacteriota bacterium]